MMKKKKGDTAVAVVGSIVLILIVIFLYMNLTGRSFGSFLSTTDTVQDTFIKQELAKCSEQKGADFDKDLLPDFCDNCPLVSNVLGDDKDGDLFPKGCCGNDGKYGFLKDPNKGYVEGNYKEVGWCGEEKMEKDFVTETPPHPKYNPSLR